MPITNLDQLLNALANSAITREISKIQMFSSAIVAGQIFSFWTAAGTPVGAPTPTGTAICTKDTLGAITFTNPGGGARTHAALLNMSANQAGHDIQFHDRLGHSVVDPTITTLQSVNLDISGAGNNLPARRGAADYSDVQWWLEWYVLTASSATITVTYTNAAGTSGRTVNIVNGANSRQGRMIPIIGADGEHIRSVQSIQLSGSLGAGSFGASASRSLFGSSQPTSGIQVSSDALRLGLPRIHDDACLFPIIIAGTTTVGTITGNIKMIQG